MSVSSLRGGRRRPGPLASRRTRLALPLLAACWLLALPAWGEDRSLSYLDQGLRQLQRLEANIDRLGPERDAAAALAAAHLASVGRPTTEAAVHSATSLLGECDGRWHGPHCERAQLAVQRILLRYDSLFEEPLRSRLRAAAAAVAPAPGPPEWENPWSFKETENQRIVKAARSLVGLRVAGRGGSEEAKAWARYTEAFLEAHRRQGWYEEESPGYLGISMQALLHLADFAPDDATGSRARLGARRELDRLFASWAELQVGGYPAGPKSRTYVHWALGPRMVPWRCWAWLLTGRGETRELNFGDFPELATSPYRPPPEVAELLSGRRDLGTYEVRRRRRIQPVHRRDLDTALYSYATPDFILSSAQAVDGLRLAVSGGEEIMVTLYPEGEEFAPLYLWSRSLPPSRARRWRSAAGRDLAVQDRDLVLARLGEGGGEQQRLGYVYLAPPWGKPELLDGVLFASYGDTLVALRAIGGWQLAPAPQRFPEIYGRDKHYRGSWVAVAREQPARVALRVARRAEVEDVAAFRRQASAARLTMEEGMLLFEGGSGRSLRFEPGTRALVGEERLTPPPVGELSSSPWLQGEGGRWILRRDGEELLLDGASGREGSVEKGE